MYALCPECNSSQHITPKRLKKKQGMIICASCAHKFNALPSLSDTPHKQKDTIADHDIYNWQKPSISHNGLWLTASLFGLALLAYQIYYFTGYRLSQNPEIRSWLKTVSSSINYPLPAYRNLAEFTTVGSAFTVTADNNYRLQVNIINHANFSQSLPDLQLNLQDLHGGIFAQRTFSPHEYLPQTNPPIFIKPSASLEIDLLIAAPVQQSIIGGYSIALK